ncbi:LysR substrate-binding domain-containing protein [Phreatobacter stygius]|uniref:LysR family transcriptional regulator n=1 Tax=Phreatobacter stygius TaxID=1940610 RepID=A0A4D7B6K3_9HYPH|nr:LysR substrate-binding domain-containing protein [Phreatobacter stygius]QCI66008.1 LysR family transcriptional regulator [Phreatobacter stygius]
MIKGMPPLKCLLTFSAVMETGSFARAADQLNVTPSAVSHQIRALEDFLGKPLFVRAKRTVLPTEDALAYAAALGESFTRIAIATSRFAASGGVLRLMLHSAPSLATLWLVPRLGSFKRRHPEIDLTLFAGHEPAKLGGDGFMIDIQYARPVPEACDSIVLAEERVVPLASPAFVAEHGLTDLDAIARVPVIHSVRCVVQWDEWIARHAPDVMLNRRGMQFDRAFLALMAAADGLGMVLESELQATDMLRAGKLVMPFGPIGVGSVAHRVVYRREDRTRPQIEAFVAWITEEMAADRAAGLSAE